MTKIKIQLTRKPSWETCATGIKLAKKLPYETFMELYKLGAVFRTETGWEVWPDKIPGEKFEVEYV